MRFFIGAIISSFILSPVSVLSLVVDVPSTNSMAHIKANDGYVQRPFLASNSPLGSSLQKRFCLWGCSKKYESGYQCKKKFFNQDKIRMAKIAACKKIKSNKQKSSFPSLHTASKFDTPGPYLEWPIRRNGGFYNRWSRSQYRIVLTKDCKVVGAVIRNKNSSYSKCTYVDDENDKEDKD